MTRLINRRSLLIQSAQREFYPFPSDRFHRININDNSYAAAPFRTRSSSRLLILASGRASLLVDAFPHCATARARPVISHLFSTIERYLKPRENFFVPYHAAPSNAVPPRRGAMHRPSAGRGDGQTNGRWYTATSKPGLAWHKPGERVDEMTAG